MGNPDIHSPKVLASGFFMEIFEFDFKLYIILTYLKSHDTLPGKPINIQ